MTFMGGCTLYMWRKNTILRIILFYFFSSFLSLYLLPSSNSMWLINNMSISLIEYAVDSMRSKRSSCMACIRIACESQWSIDSSAFVFRRPQTLVTGNIWLKQYQSQSKSTKYSKMWKMKSPDVYDLFGKFLIWIKVPTNGSHGNG